MRQSQHNTELFSSMLYHALLIYSFKANINHCSVPAPCSLSSLTLQYRDMQSCTSETKRFISGCETHLLGLIRVKTQNRTIVCRLRRQDSGRSTPSWRDGWGCRRSEGLANGMVLLGAAKGWWWAEDEGLDLDKGKWFDLKGQEVVQTPIKTGNYHLLHYKSTYVNLCTDTPCTPLLVKGFRTTLFL